MTVLEEDGLQITVAGAVNARRFDGAGHGLSHCMKAVDFVVELADRYSIHRAQGSTESEVQVGDRQRFIQGFHSGQLDEDLKYKYRDSFLYEWGIGKSEQACRLSGVDCIG